MFIVIVILLSSCSNKLVDEAIKTQEMNQIKIEEEEIKLEEEKEEQRELYKSMEKPLEEVIQENALDQKKVINQEEDISEKTNFTDETEFALYVSSVLFDFRNGTISPEEYFSFLSKHSAKDIKKEFPTDKETALLIYSNIQSLFKDNDIKPESYITSEVTLNASKKEGHFYRKILTNKGEEFYITTIVKEDGQWKFSDDSPSPPFEIQESDT